MTSFDARLRLLGEPGFPLGVEVDLSGGRMIVMAGLTEIGNWPLDQIDISALPDGFHIEAEGEHLILNVSDSARFTVELGVRRRLSDPR